MVTDGQGSAPNIDFVTDRIAIGGDLDTDVPEVAVEQLAGLIDSGITHLVDCRREWDDLDFVAERAPQIEYLHNGTDDDGTQQPDWFFDRGVDFARAALEQPDARVLLHCHMGINRGPSLGYAVMIDQGEDPIDAIAAIRAKRPIAAVGYAEDALGWHLRRTGASAAVTKAERDRLRAWLDDNEMDVLRIIRSIEGR